MFDVRFLLIAIAQLVSGGSTAPGYHRVEIQVREDATGAPLSHASVFYQGMLYTSGEDGVVHFQVVGDEPVRVPVARNGCGVDTVLVVPGQTPDPVSLRLDLDLHPHSLFGPNGVFPPPTRQQGAAPLPLIDGPVPGNGREECDEAAVG